MLHFVDDLQPLEEKTVRRALLWLSKVVHEATEKDFDLRLKALEIEMFEPLGKQPLYDTLHQMVEALACREYVYALNDYHFLLLYQALKNSITAHNNAVIQGAPGVVMDSSHVVDFGKFLDLLFWDTHFLFTADEYADLSDEKKEELQVSQQIFSIANKMCPHPDELVIRRAKKYRPERVGRI